MEREYTALIKRRQLYEGACELSWAQYFKYRERHPDCTPLSEDGNCGASHPLLLPNDFERKPQAFKMLDNAVSLMLANFAPPRFLITSYKPFEDASATIFRHALA